MLWTDFHIDNLDSRQTLNNNNEIYEDEIDNDVHMLSQKQKSNFGNSKWCSPDRRRGGGLELQEDKSNEWSTIQSGNNHTWSPVIQRKNGEVTDFYG